MKDLNIKAFNEDLKRLMNEAQNDDKISLIERFCRLSNMVKIGDQP
jgi:hypothetical protein